MKYFDQGSGIYRVSEWFNYVRRWNSSTRSLEKKLAFEASLPPTTDVASFEIRRQMMEEQETREWKDISTKNKKFIKELNNLFTNYAVYVEDIKKDTEKETK